MRKFEQYASRKKIVKYLCLLRAKRSKERNGKHLKHLLTENELYNYHFNNRRRDNLAREDEDLLRIMPPRRLWKKPSKENRFNVRGQRVNTIAYNYKALLFTIEHCRKKAPKTPFLIELERFLDEVINSIKDPDYTFNTPTTHAQKKSKDVDANNQPVWICRPITSYCLKDRVILRFVNKYLTEFMDSCFYENSFAFRAKQSRHDGKKVGYSHHKAVERLANYKRVYTGKQLWVAECDVKKFYDSVSHAMIKKKFKKLLKKAEKKHGIKCDERVIKHFYGYLNSFSFNKDVFKLNKETQYWKDQNILNGQFEWVEDELNASHYKKASRARIGVPQGGALSGLVANIVLNDADSAVVKKANSELLYLRFCDDMIIVHPDKSDCIQAFNAYQKALQKLKFVVHNPVCVSYVTQENRKKFWKEKSKHPYKWNLASFPWIGFLGYEINYDGSVRVRKKSIRTEISKQRQLGAEIKRAIANGRRRSDKYVLESFINKLVGMSVGRIRLWNYKSVENDMCWIRGFTKVNENKHLKLQLKALDRNRSIQIAKMCEFLKKNPAKKVVPSSGSKKRDVVIYGKPFSYYFQMLKNLRPTSTMATDLEMPNKQLSEACV